ncbi:MAG TPA: hypothetical protein VHK86_08270 [Nitrososphaera sp.]|jgi:hypothetical protein|nr:hypothetical protein [Nitrososphaera sp.]HEX2615359.1 hypothetical protein [Nitrososphaera sp.]
MVEKMTAVWLIILTIMVCAAVPAVLIWLTTTPHTAATKMMLFPLVDRVPAYLALH